MDYGSSLNLLTGLFVSWWSGTWRSLLILCKGFLLLILFYSCFACDCLLWRIMLCLHIISLYEETGKFSSYHILSVLWFSRETEDFLGILWHNVTLRFSNLPVRKVAIFLTRTLKYLLYCLYFLSSGVIW